MVVDDVLPDLAAAIRELPDSADVRRLRDTLTAAWTSSSELLGEIGAAIRRIEASSPELPVAVRRSFERALRAIHTVWPAI